MGQTIQWTHASGETVEYKSIRALAEVLGVALTTADKYLRQGIHADADLPRVGRPPRGYIKPSLPPANKRYLDFIAEMETWEA